MRRRTADLAAIGWRHRSGIYPGLEIDQINEAGFHVARIWQGSGVCSRRPNESFDDSRDGVVAILQVLGSARVLLGDAAREDDGERERTLAEGELIIVTDSSGLAYSSDEPAARIELRFPVPTEHYLHPTEVHAMDETPFAEALMAVTNAMLNGPPPRTPRQFINLQLSMWELLTALRSSRLRRTREASAREHDLFQRAVATIASQCQDPAFTASDVSAQLHISDRYLRTIFTKHGDSPRGMLRRGRVSLALHALRETTVIEPLHNDAFARSVGFSSARMLRDALARINERPAAPGTSPGPRRWHASDAPGLGDALYLSE